MREKRWAIVPVPPEAIARSRFMQKAKTPEPELLREVGVLLGYADTPKFEDLGFRRDLKNLRRIPMTRAHLLAACVELLERKRDGKTTTRSEFANFVGMSIIEGGTDPILTALPENIASLIHGKPARGRTKLISNQKKGVT